MAATCCRECDTPLDEAPGTPVAERLACSKCGCLDRRYVGEGAENVDLAASDVIVVDKDLTLRWSVEAAYSIIDKSRFFLANAERAQEAVDRRAFVYNLEAAVVFARSITLHLQKQLRHASGFDSWYEGRQLEMRSNPEMRFMVDTRSLILKESQLTVRASYDVSLHDAASISDSISVTLQRGDGVTTTHQLTSGTDVESPSRERVNRLGPTGSGVDSGSSPTTSVVFHFQDDERSEPAIGRVSRYVDLLEEIVHEANRRFGSRQ